MGGKSRWYVDTNKKGSTIFSNTIYDITDNTGGFSLPWNIELREFIIGLVKHIERLESDLIWCKEAREEAESIAEWGE